MILYNIPLQDAQGQTVDAGVASAIQTAGLVDESGQLATEQIATENVDRVVVGQFRHGERFAAKYADELESIGESGYAGVPIYDEDADDLGRERGYYEVEQVDVNPAQRNTRDTFEYTVTLAFTGTRQTHWRAVAVREETVNAGFAATNRDRIAIPAAAGKRRWFDTAQGKEAATATDTVGLAGKRGFVDLFDPDDPSFDDPVLLYEAGFDEAAADVFVYDDRGLPEYFTLDSNQTNVGEATVGDATVSPSIREFQWTHVYHAAYEFDGRPVVDNGRLRVRFDEANGIVRPYRWDGSAWALESLSHGDYELVDADVEVIGPALVDVFTEWVDTSDGSIHEAVLSVQRGARDAVVRETDNGTLPAGLEAVLAPVAAAWNADPRPQQTLKSRGEVK